eukprot:m.67932 g.67932  ORF g.67932 m.67932 type:complete len:420 (+) comp23888_c0_seq1:35-1294(+)
MCDPFLSTIISTSRQVARKQFFDLKSYFVDMMEESDVREVETKETDELNSKDGNKSEGTWPPPWNNLYARWDPLPEILAETTELISMKFVRPIVERSEAEPGLGFEWKLAEIWSGKGSLVVATQIVHPRKNSGLVCLKHSVDSDEYHVDNPTTVEPGDMIVGVGTAKLREEPRGRIEVLLNRAGELPRVGVQVLRVARQQLIRVLEWEARVLRICDIHNKTDAAHAHGAFVLGLVAALDSPQDDLRSERQKHCWRANALIACGSVEAAVTEAELAVKISLELNDDSLQSGAHEVLAKCYLKNESFDKATATLWQQAACDERLQDYGALVSVYYNLAQIPELTRLAVHDSTQVWGGMKMLMSETFHQLGTMITGPEEAATHLMGRCTAAGALATKQGITLTPEQQYHYGKCVGRWRVTTV